MSEESIKIKEPLVLFHKTQAIIQRLEELLGGPVITYWNGYRGSVCHNDVLGFYELLDGIGQSERIHLFIKSDGGNGQASIRIVNLIRQYTDNLIALTPLECASAATMLAIGANEIRMGLMAYLSAVDTSLTHDLSPLDRDNNCVSVSLDELNRIVRLWESNQVKGSETNPCQHLFEHIHPLVIGEVDRAESLSIMLCEEILSYHIKDSAKVKAIANTLNAKYPSHAYPILLDEARKIGLNATLMDKEVNNLLLDLHQIYSETGQKATTDFDETHSHYHSNEILNILEASNRQIFYQNDKDWFYRVEERHWVTMNDNSSWRRIERRNGKTHKSTLHIA